MKTILKYYNDICNKKYQHLGFKRSKKTFARINGDVLQSFTFKCICAPVCSIEFGIFPLCMPTPIFIDSGGYELDKFVVEIYEKSSGWPFDPHSDESMKKCIESVSEAIDFYLLPFFDICNDCRSSLHELRKIEELFEGNRQKVLHLRGESDCAIPWEERSLFDSRKYYMALKAQDLLYSRQYLCHQIASHEKMLNAFNCPTSPKQPESVKVGLGERLIQYADELKQVEAGNWEYFNKIICFNEEMMKTYITTKYPNIWNS